MSSKTTASFTHNKHSNNFKCRYCERSFKSYQSLKNHSESLHKFICWTCKIDCKNDYDLKDHLEKVHINAFKCLYCQKRFGSKIELNAHSKLNHPHCIYCKQGNTCR